MNRLDNRTVGWTTIAAGLTAVLASAALLGFFAGGGILGGMGDLMDVLNSALIIPLFLALGHYSMDRNKILGRAIQVLGGGGAATRLAGAFLILTNTITYDNAVPLVNGGMGLMGLAIVISMLVNRTRPELRTGYFVFSLIVGVVLGIGIVGVFLNDAYTPLLTGEVGMVDFNPILLVLLFTTLPVSLLGYPIWLLWTGRLFLKNPKMVAGRAVAV